MDNFESIDASGSNTQGTTASKAKSVVCWTNSMSTMMLGFLADIVASGKRTSSGFKQCHHNQCAQALNEHFKLSLNHDQISNHLKKWRNIWGRLVQLKNLSGALWDEDTCTIGLSGEHYAGHCAISFYLLHAIYYHEVMCTICFSLVHLFVEQQT
jgi:1,4-alpha-glucan branching enzyme